MPAEAGRHVYRGQLPRYDSVLLSITERCHVGCAHCGFLGAKREREATLDEIALWTNQICEYEGVERLIMTGGEPFERLDAVETAVSVAAGRLPIISIFTSSFWAKSLPDARATLTRLSGLRQLYLSSDPYHQRRVPYEFVDNAIRSACELGIEFITICITYGNDAELEEVRSHYAQWGSRIAFHEDRVIPTPFLSKRVMARQDFGNPVRAADYARTCYLQTPLINPNGEVFACHSGKAAAHRDFKSSPFYLGSLREDSLRDVATRASRRWDYQYMRTHGPKGVAALVEADQAVLIDVGRAEFTSACDMCFSVLKTRCGTDALNQACKVPGVQDAINLRLALGLGEEPIQC